MENEFCIESSFSLKKWVKNDLNFSSPPKINPEKLKKKLSSINFNDLATNTSFRTKISNILAADECSINDYLQELYLDCFFKKSNYDKYIAYLKNGNEAIDLDKKLKGLNYAHNYSFISLLSNDPRCFTQIERASVITKAALDLYSKFRKNNFKTYLNPQGILNTHLYKYFFASNISPNIERPFDELNANINSSHIIIMLCGQAYKLIVIRDNHFISVNELKSAIEEIKQLNNNDPSLSPIGALSTASRLKRFEIRQSKFSINKQFFDDLESAIFVLCLDSKPYGLQTAENMLSYQFQNRYYGNTQIVIGTQGECGVITNYATVDGTQAIEIIDTIYQESLKINFLNQQTDNALLSKLEIELTPYELKLLESDTKKVLHDSKSSYLLDIGVDFFKDISLNPNVTMNFIVMLAVREIVNVIPVTNHAVSRREHNSPLGQLDWLYVSPEKLTDFYEISKNYPELNYELDMFVHEPPTDLFPTKPQKICLFPVNENWNYRIFNQKFLCQGRISNEKLDLALETTMSSLPIDKNQYRLTPQQQSKLIYTILTQEKFFSKLDGLHLLFNEAIALHKEKIDLTKRSFCPTSFFSKPNGELFDKLSDFYLDLGQFWPAYRNYLFRAYRNNKSIDVMISSLRLPPSIQTLGRHGVCSEMLTMFGLHILMKNKQTELVFMPNRDWVHRLEDVVDKIKEWSIKIHLIAHAEIATPQTLWGCTKDFPKPSLFLEVID